MSHIVLLAENPLEPSSWVTHEGVEHVGEFLMERYPVWPETARIYHRQVAQACDVTPRSPAEVAALEELEGSIIVVVYPGNPLIIIAIIAVVIAVAAIALAFLLRPKQNVQSPSPNNSLSDRQNEARPNQRIPDIYGTLRSTPDLVSSPYSIFVDNVELELTYMCIGRGSFTIQDMRDDVTPIVQIDGSTVEVWAPFTSPNSGDQAQQVFGVPLTQPMLATSKSNVINGQELQPPNANSYSGNDNVQFWYTDTIIVQNNTSNTLDMTDYFAVGDTLVVSNANLNISGQAINLDGSYPVLSVTTDTIVLGETTAINPAWSLVAALPLGGTGNTSATISTTSERWVGPYILTQPVDLNTGSPTQNTVICNFIAANGLYTVDSNNNQGSYDVQIQVGVTQTDPLTNLPFGPEYMYYCTVPGSSTSKLQRAVTLQITTPFTGPSQVRAKRNTNTDLKFNGTVEDTIQWRDYYAGSPISVHDFGNVTTLYCATYATQAALTVTERKINTLVTRNLQTGLNTDSPGFGPSNYLADTFYAICVDPYLGNLPASQVDIPGIYATSQEIQSYFGCPDAVQFCYTFDKSNTSFEEMLIQLAQATFSTAYRQGSVLKLTFERQTGDAVLLFNHRNKLPGSETRTVSFGTESNYDGVQYDFVSPVDDSQQTYYIPADRSAVNPTHVSSVGIRSFLQAYFQSWRIWNKLLYQNTQVQFDATQEANLTILTDRVLVADNTRGDTQDGEVLGQNVLELELSQPYELKGGVSYTIYLQSPDGSVEGIPMTAGSDEYHVLLSAPPSQPLSIGTGLYANATYIIAGSTDARPSPMLVTKKEPKDFYVTTMTCVNYDDRYYQNDRDYVTGVISPVLPVTNADGVVALNADGSPVTTGTPGFTVGVNGAIGAGGIGGLNINVEQF